MRLLYLFLLSNISCIAFGQFAGSVYFLSKDLQFSNADITTTTIQYEISYWTRLKNKRLEFYPSLFYQSGDYFDANIDNGEDGNLGARLWIVAYPFDFGSDCNCPTFSKQNELLKKGFFVQVAPEYIWADNDYWSINAGVGLDIGITNLLTIAPAINYRQSFIATENLNFIMPSIRLSVRLDKRNY